MLVILGQFLGREFVDRVPAFVLRKPGIRQHRNFLGRIQRQIADRIVHLLRPGRAVQPDHIDVERLERGQRRADLRAQQHRAGFLQRDLHRHRQPLPGFPHRFEHADGRDLGLQQVLRGLDQQHIDAAFDQRRGLLLVSRNHRSKLMCPSDGSLVVGPIDPATNRGRSLVENCCATSLASLRGLDVDLVHPVAQFEFAEHDRASRRTYWSRRCRSPRGKSPHECRE